MSYVVAIRGVRSTKTIGGLRRKVIPFVGADREGEFAQLGVGFSSGDLEVIWGLVVPHSLIRSWRGMKLLEKLPQIDSSTLCACWTVATRNLHESDERYLDELAKLLDGADKLHELLDEILNSSPDALELDTMIRNLRSRKISIDDWELKEELAAKRIAMSELIKTLIREGEERRKQYEIQQKEINKPVPPQESLGVFFKDLGIANFIVGGGVGGYGMDWGHIGLEELDRTVKQDSFSKYLPEGHLLEHTTKGPETVSVQLSDAMAVHLTSFGEFEQPWFQASDGKRYTFISAKFREGHFFVVVKIEEEGLEPKEGEYTVSELRLILGPYLQRQKPSWLTRFFHRKRK